MAELSSLRRLGGTALSDLAEQDQLTLAQRIVNENPGSTVRGFRAGLTGISANSYANEALDAERAGDLPRASALRQRAMELAGEAQAIAPPVNSVADINSLSSAGEFAKGMIGQGVASTLPAIGGAVAARFLGPRALGPLREMAGAAVPSYFQERGEAAVGQYADPVAAAAPVEDRAQAATVKGLVNAGMEAFVPAGLVRNFATKGAGRKFAGELGENFAKEGITETGQTRVGQLAAGYVNPERDTSKDRQELIDAFVGGGVGGAAMATPGALLANIPAAAASFRDSPIVKDTLSKLDVRDRINRLRNAGDDKALVGGSFEETMDNLKNAGTRGAEAAIKTMQELLADPSIPQNIKDSLSPLDPSTPEGQRMVGETLAEVQAQREVPSALDKLKEFGSKLTRMNEQDPESIKQVVGAITPHLRPEALRAAPPEQLYELAKVLGNLSAREAEIDDNTLRAFGGFKTLDALTDNPEALLDSVGLAVSSERTLRNRFNKLDSASEDAANGPTAFFAKALPAEARSVFAEYNPAAQRALYRRLGGLIDDVANGRLSTEKGQHQAAMQQLDEVFGKDGASAVLEFYSRSNNKLRDPSANGVRTTGVQEPARGEETALDEDVADSPDEGLSESTVSTSHIFKNPERKMPFYADEIDLGKDQVREARGSGNAKMVRFGEYVESEKGDIVSEATRIRDELQRLNEKDAGRKNDMTPQRREWMKRRQSMIEEIDQALNTKAARRVDERTHTARRELKRLETAREELISKGVGEADIAEIDGMIAEQRARVSQFQKEFISSRKDAPTNAKNESLKAVYEVLNKYAVGKIEGSRDVGGFTADDRFIQEAKAGLKKRTRVADEVVSFTTSDGGTLKLHVPSLMRAARSRITDEQGRNEAERSINAFTTAITSVLNRPGITGVEQGVENKILGNKFAKERNIAAKKLADVREQKDAAFKTKNREKFLRLEEQEKDLADAVAKMDQFDVRFGEFEAMRQDEQNLTQEMDKRVAKLKELREKRGKLGAFIDAWASQQGENDRGWPRTEKAVEAVAKATGLKPLTVRAQMERYGSGKAIKAKFREYRTEIAKLVNWIDHWKTDAMSTYEEDPDAREGATDLFDEIIESNPLQMQREEQFKDHNPNEDGRAASLTGPSRNKADVKSLEPALKEVVAPKTEEKERDRRVERQESLLREEAQRATREGGLEEGVKQAEKAANDKARITKRDEQKTNRRRKQMEAVDALSVKDAIERMRGTAGLKVVLDQSAKDIGGSGKWEFDTKTKERVIYVARNAMNPLSVAYHESLHDFFHLLGNDARARQLRSQMEQYAGSPAIKKQLKELLKDHPKALAAIDKSTEETLAYAFQFWATGDLRVGPSTQNFFQKIMQMIRNVLGVMSQDEKVLAVFDALHDGKLANPNTVFEVLKDLRAETLHEKLKRIVPPITNAADKLLLSATDRLREPKIEALDKIADMFHKTPDREQGELGFLQKSAMARGQWMNKLQTVLTDSTNEQRRVALEELQAQNPQSELAKKVAGLLGDLFDYTIAKGVQRRELNKDWKPGDDPEDKFILVTPKKVKNYFPRNWDPDAIRSKRDEFEKLLRDEGKLNVAEANEIIESLISSSGQEDITEGAVRRPVGFTPWDKAVLGRQLTFIKASNAAKFAAFQEKDLTHTLTQYINQATHRAEYVEKFGNFGEKLQEAFKEAKAQGATEAELKDASLAIRAMEGSLGWDLDDRVRRVMGGLVTYENIVLLPFSLFSSLIDPLGVGLRSNDMGEAWNALKEGIKGIFSLGENKSEMAKLANDLGVIDETNMIESMGMVYNGKYMSKTMHKVNKWFFKLNGMEEWNSRMRVAALSAGKRFIEKHAAGHNEHSSRYMKELGLENWSPTYDKQGDLIIDEKYKEALFRFVDGSVLRPNAAQRPVWGSDPQWMLLFHLKQFTFSFQKTILNRVGHELAHGNNYAAWVLASYVPFMIVSDVFRGMLTGGVRTNWDMWDYLANGVARSGVLGLGSFAADALQDAAMNQAPGVSLLGPTAGHAIFATQTLGSQKDFADLLLRSVPASPLVKSMA